MVISRRQHGIIDYAVTAGLAALAISRLFSPPTRTALGVAGLFGAAYSAVTDYEAGLVRGITMRQHLMLDAASGASLCAAALAMTRRPASERVLLAAVGLAELGVVALSDSKPRHPVHAHGGMTYPPLNVPKPLDIGVWLVDSVIGPGIPVRMTIIRLDDGSLLLHSPTRFSPALLRQVSELGRIRHLVAPNIAHWVFVRDWQRAVHDTTVWAAPGLRKRGQVKRSGLRIDHDLGDAPPAEWAGQIDQALVRGGGGFNEVAMFHQPTRTLVLTDLVQNWEPGKLPAVLRPLARLLGITAPAGRAPAYLRAVVKLNRAEAAADAAKILRWNPRRVIMAHGTPFEPDAVQQLRRSLAWLTA